MLLLKCCTQYVSKFGKLSSGHRTGKGSVFIPIPKKDNAKEYSNYHTLTLISHASKIMLKILQIKIQQYMNQELPGMQPGFRKGRGTRDQIADSFWITEKSKGIPKTSTSTSLIVLKPLIVWITTNCGKILKRWGYLTKFTYLLRNPCAGQEAIVRTGHGTADWFKVGKRVCQGILSPCLFNLYGEYIM